jgi:hypothetical protein
MLALLKKLGSSCWGDHEWLYRTSERGLWLECRQCGRVSQGFDLPAAQYRRTQDAVASAHRIGGVPPARQATATAASQGEAAVSPSVVRNISALRAQAAGAAQSQPAMWVTPIATSEAERRWLQAWRQMSPEARARAERLVARLAARDAARRVAHAS